MKKFLLILGILLLTRFAFADVTAEIVAKDIDDNGNIRVWAQYKVDGVEVASRYAPIDCKQVYCTRYSYQNFYGLTDAEIISRIKQDLTQHAQSLIAKKFIVEKNAVMTLDGVVGEKVTEKEATIHVSPTKELTVKTDGTYVEKAVIAAPVI